MKNIYNWVMHRMMAVNGRYTSRRMTGVERYASEVTSRLGERVRLITPSASIQGIPGHLWEQAALPLLLRKGEFLWSPANTGPLSVSRQIVTIHDVSFLDHPEWFDPKFAAWYRFLMPRLASRACLILTVSQYSKIRIHEALWISEERIKVIPAGVNLEQFDPGIDANQVELRRCYDLPEEYILAVGSLEPRKNLAGLIRVWKRIGARYESIRLVIAGGQGRAFRNPQFSAIPSRVQFLGYVPESDLAALYIGAKALILPSLYEGFGLSALEAMACGTPLLASCTAALPEVVGEAGLLVDPEDEEAMGNSLQRLLEDDTLRVELRRRGLARAKNFSWEQTTEKVWEALCEAAQA